MWPVAPARRQPHSGVAAVADAIGAARTGLRISPGNTLGDIHEPEPAATYLALVRALEPIGPAYLHIAESGDRALTPELRKRFTGVLISTPAPTGARRARRSWR